MNETEKVLVKLETTIQFMTTSFNDKLDNFEEKMDLKLQNITDKLDSQNEKHEKDIVVQKEATEVVLQKVSDIEGRVKNLEDRPANDALKDKTNFKDTMKEFAYKTAAVGIIGLVLVLVFTTVNNYGLLSPSQKEAITKVLP